jgi:hypothetical protein
MLAFIGETLLSSSMTRPRSKPFEIYDSRLRGFTLRVQPSGHCSYYARFGRNRRIALGNVESLTPLEARERCRKVLGNVVHGNHPLHGINGSDGMTLGMFIADAYTTWIRASRPRTAANTLEKLHRHFRTWYPEPLTAITVERIESWKARRLGEGRSPSTILRDLFTLSSVLRRAVKAPLARFAPSLRLGLGPARYRSIPSEICLDTVPCRCRCATRTWRPINGARRWPSSMRSRFLRLPCAYRGTSFPATALTI